jgi:glyoxylase-like metal-dependent hydrolase (beta-lactamase superfamily II)
MKFITYPAGIYQSNCYIVYDESTGSGFIIDPGGDAAEIIEASVKNSININFIILTHGHFDHTGAVNTIKEMLKIPVYMNERDSYLVSGGNMISRMLPVSDKILVDRYINDGDIIQYGSENLTIIETPGHTPGGVTIFTAGSLFTGDTLFEESIGRTDFPGGSLEQIRSSVTQKLFIYPDSTPVYPGHGGFTTIGHEKVYNPFL